MDWISELVNWVVAWANTPYGGLALAMLAFAESSFFPVPPDVLLIALCILNPEKAISYAGICSSASVLGGAFGYWLGKNGGRPLLKRLFAEAKIQLVEHYYQRYDVWAVGIAGFTPIPYKVFTIAAGVFLVNFKRFVLASLLGRSGRFFLVAGLLYFFGQSVTVFIQKYLNVLSVALVALLILGFWSLGYLSKRHLAKETIAAKIPIEK